MPSLCAVAMTKWDIDDYEHNQLDTGTLYEK